MEDNMKSNSNDQVAVRGGRKGSVSKDGLPPHMKFSRAASYNNPHEMFPSASRLFSGITEHTTKLGLQGQYKLY